MNGLLVALLVAVGGCAVSLGPVGSMRPVADPVGAKVLRPRAAGRSCRTSVLGIPLQAGDPELREALAEILALDGEGDVVTSAEVRWQRIMTVVYNRRCVEVLGDLGRTISTVTLPISPGHIGHGH